MKGGCLIVFPAGGVSTTPKPWSRHAIDAEWKNFTARLIRGAKARWRRSFSRARTAGCFRSPAIQPDASAVAAVQGSARPHRQRDSCPHRRCDPVQGFGMLDRNQLMELLAQANLCAGRRSAGARKCAAGGPRTRTKARRHAVTHAPSRRAVRHLPCRSRSPADRICGRQAAAEQAGCDVDGAGANLLRPAGL